MSSPMSTEPTTLRGLIFRKLYGNLITARPRFYSPWCLTLDRPLVPRLIDYFAHLINKTDVEEYPEPRLTLCSMCQLLKFEDQQCATQSSFLYVIAMNSISWIRGLPEFDPVWGTTSCCRRRICNSCLYSILATRIHDSVWEDLLRGSSLRLPCPRPGCGHSFVLQAKSEGSFLDWLLASAFDCPDLGRSLEESRQASLLRRRLHSIVVEQSISQDGIQLSRALHKRLVDNGYMMPLIDRWRPGALLDGDVRIVDIEATPRRGSLRIPLFMGNFIKEARECSVCTMTLGAVGTGDPEYWAHAIRGCRGDWTWKVSDFPTSEVLPECRHEFDICRECIATYIDVQLKSRGRNAVDHIACPSSDCSHEFTYAEMRRLATPESFSKYDHLATIDALSAMPSFRWCLSPDCSSGGFYAPPSTCEKSSSLRSIHPIMCSDCGFEMCFECDSPWHELLTCEQYQSQSSAEWIRTHTKRCPGEGCGVPLEKDNGCFQMSCAQCRHEFCWECLAAWDTIFVDELYIREGHAEGCYFRREGAWWPTMLTGADLEEALEGRDHIMYLDQEDSDDGEDYYYDYDYVD